MTTAVTSRAAFDSIRPHLNVLQDLVLKEFTRAGTAGLTSEELHTKFYGYKETSTRTRISELVRAGYLKDSDMTRLSSSGRAMTVWVVR